MRSSNVLWLAPLNVAFSLMKQRLAATRQAFIRAFNRLLDGHADTFANVDALAEYRKKKESRES